MNSTAAVATFSGNRCKARVLETVSVASPAFIVKVVLLHDHNGHSATAPGSASVR